MDDAGSMVASDISGVFHCSTAANYLDPFLCVHEEDSGSAMTQRLQHQQRNYRGKITTWEQGGFYGFSPITSQSDAMLQSSTMKMKLPSLIDCSYDLRGLFSRSPCNFLFCRSHLWSSQGQLNEGINREEGSVVRLFFTYRDNKMTTRKLHAESRGNIA
ncbi:hypothetical protein ZWY2020_032350 [Hordeum vulgare]|nr:hypothetical protein ZWY2020_032350 [Hordeum vulgare]